MKKTSWLWILLASAATLYAQNNEFLGQEDLLEAFRQYNPDALEMAASNAPYGKILYDLAQTYRAPRTEEQKYALIALVKNFENSIILQVISREYMQARQLQAVSGTELPSLQENTQAKIALLLWDVHQKTLEVKKLQLADHKQILKQIRQDKSLSAAQKKERLQAQKEHIKQIKKELRQFKANAKQKIYLTAQAYAQQLAAAYVSAQAGQFPAAGASVADIKSNPQKTAAQ